MLKLERLKYLGEMAARTEGAMEWTTREILRDVIDHLCSIHPDNVKKEVESFDEAPSLRFRLEEARSQRDAAQDRVQELEKECERLRLMVKKNTGVLAKKIVVQVSQHDTDFNVWAGEPEQGDLLAWGRTSGQAEAMAHCIRTWAGIGEEGE